MAVFAKVERQFMLLLANNKKLRVACKSHFNQMRRFLCFVGDT